MGWCSGLFSPMAAMVASPLISVSDMDCLSICIPRLILGSAVHAAKGKV